MSLAASIRLKTLRHGRRSQRQLPVGVCGRCSLERVVLCRSRPVSCHAVIMFVLLSNEGVRVGETKAFSLGARR